MSSLRLGSILGVLSLALAALPAHAAPQFTSISHSDFEAITREFSADSSWHSVTTPSSGGSVFGFELGFVAGVAKSPDTNAIMQRNGSSAEAKMLPHAGLLGAISIPFGLTIEALFLPKVDTGDFKFEQYGGALKYTFIDLPVHFSARAFMTKTDISFKQTMNEPTTNLPVNASVAFAGSVQGVQLFVSPALLPVVEPYIGVGWLSGKGNMDVTGTNATIYLSGQQKDEATATSTQMFIGIDIRLLVGMGLEYSRAFGTDTVTGKFSFKF